MSRLGDSAYKSGGIRLNCLHTPGEISMSIVRMGMAEDDKFGSGYEAIFGKKKPEAEPAKAEKKKDKEKKKEKKKKK